MRVALVMLVLLLLLSGCPAMLVDMGKVACYHTMLFQDCKLTGER